MDFTEFNGEAVERVLESRKVMLDRLKGLLDPSELDEASGMDTRGGNLCHVVSQYIAGLDATLDAYTATSTTWVSPARLSPTR